MSYFWTSNVMKKTTCFLLIMIVAVIFLISACNLPVPASMPAQSTPTQPVSVDTVVPIQSVPAATVIPTQKIFAPACAPCAAPAVVDTEPNETYCVKKIPYQNFTVEPGAKFEPVDPSGGLKCVDSGMVNGLGLKVWTCTGKQLWTYELKITSPSCSSRMILETNTDHCQTGLGYSAAQNCCAPLAGGDSVSVIVKVNMGACK